MLSSTPMTETCHTSPVQLSEDVQDILHYAKKFALKDKNPVLCDRYLLLGLLRSNRLFTRSDALLKCSGTSAKRLLKLYRQEEPNFDANSASSSALMERAKQVAEASPVDDKPRIEIEHFLLALLSSPDPLVQTVLAKGQFTQDTLNQALPKVRQESAKRFALYCVREILEVVVVVLCLVILIKQGLGEFRLIPSESMVPTLQIGDRIAVEKVSHWARKPQRGDILVFYPPEPETFLPQDPWSIFLRLTGFSGIIYDRESRIDTAFIKRVIGLPGDTVEVRPGVGVFVNNKLLDEPYAEEVANTCTFVNSCGPVKVPPQMYYMMGDNRNHSADSRYWYFLPEERIIGRAVFRFFPIDGRMGVLKAPTYSEQ